MYLPKISIIVPNYNRSGLIQELIKSVVAQTYENWELILVDDESTDDSITIIEKFCTVDFRIKLIKRNRKPSGAPTCRNMGIDASTGEFIMFLDSDDLLMKDCLERRIKVTEANPATHYFAFPAIRFEGDISNTSSLFYANDDHLDIIAAFILRPQWCVCGSLITQSLLESSQVRFEEGLTKWQDWEFHLRILIKHPKIVRGYNEPDTLIRKHSDSVRINYQANKSNKAHSSILDLMKKIQQELKHAGVFKNEVKEAFFWRCYELIAFLVNSNNVRLAIDVNKWMFLTFEEYKIGTSRLTKYLLVLLLPISKSKQMRTVIYRIFINKLSKGKNSLLNNATNS